MKIFLALIPFFSLFLISCEEDKIAALEAKFTNHEEKIRTLELEIGKLQQELDAIQSEKSSFKKNNSASSEVSSNVKHYSSLDIVNIVKEELSFRCPNVLAKDFVIRKTDNNKYEVRFIQLNEDGDNKEWEQVIVRVQLFPGNKYTYQVWDGPDGC